MTSKDKLKYISNLVGFIDYTKEKYQRDIEEDLEVLEIIKKHEVNLYELKRIDGVKNYNLYGTEEEFQKLTDEEFDLIKEWLK